MDLFSFSFFSSPNSIAHVGQLHAVCLQGMCNNLYLFKSAA
jgi:hypothetical protein